MSRHLSNSNQPEAGQPSPFGGKAGEAVSEVDADDVKAVWQKYRELQDRHPGHHVAIGLEILKSVCKAGANVEAVYYRQVQLDFVKILAEHNAIPQASRDLLTAGGEFKDSAFEAIAKIPMEWIGEWTAAGPPLRCGAVHKARVHIVRAVLSPMLASLHSRHELGCIGSAGI